MNEQPRRTAGSPRPAPFQFGLGAIMIFSFVICLEFAAEQFHPGGALAAAVAVAYGSGGILVVLAVVSSFWPRAKDILHRLAPWSGLLWASCAVVYFLLVAAGRLQ
jgi:hypothetical protein